MSSAHFILLGLIGLCPVIVTVDGPLLPYLVPFLLAAGIILVSVKLPAREAQPASTDTAAYGRRRLREGLLGQDQHGERCVDKRLNFVTALM